MIAAFVQDVMQVCVNGHVVTDLLHTHPELGRSHCERCGAATLERCLTCGQDLPGAIPVPGLTPVGLRRPPARCPMCGAAFPWTERPRCRQLPSWPLLENLLRRLPRVARQLRARHGDRPAFGVVDVFDVEDLLRALLPLHFEDVRPECRTPSYSPGTRTDFVLASEHIAVTCKYVTSSLGEAQLAQERQADVAYYQGQERCRGLVLFVHDPVQRLHEPQRLEAVLGRDEEDLLVRCLITG